MSCFPCFGSHRTKRSNSRRVDHAHASPVENEMKKQKPAATQVEVDVSQINAKTYTFRELATATKNFRQECLLGEGGFGRVYKGTLQSSGQVVAVKQLDRNGMQGNKEFLGEVLSLSLLHHPNLVNLIGYCADGDQRLLVHEFIPGGTLEDHVLGNESGHETLNWYTRIKIAYGTALGLEYLHEKANPPIIYRDLKSSNILIDEEFNPKLSDIGLAKLGHNGDKMHGPSRLMGAYGFCAPEYSRTGEVTMKSDVYSYGVILLELITGRRAIDTTRANHEQNLVAWAQPLFRDPKNFPDMADPLLKKQFPEKDLNQAVAIAAMCLQEEATVRPFMSDVVTTLSFLSTTPPPDEAVPSPVPDSSDGSECISDDDGESIRSTDNNRHDGIAGNEAVTGSSNQYLSFERDESVSSSNHTVSKSNKGDHHHMVSNSSQDKYESVNSRSNSGESAEEDQGVCDKNSAVTQKEEKKSVGDGGVSLIGVMTSRSPENRIQKGDSKSLNYLDRTRSRREPVLPVNIQPIKTAL